MDSPTYAVGHMAGPHRARRALGHDVRPPIFGDGDARCTLYALALTTPDTWTSASGPSLRDASYPWPEDRMDRNITPCAIVLSLIDKPLNISRAPMESAGHACVKHDAIRVVS